MGWFLISETIPDIGYCVMKTKSDIGNGCGRRVGRPKGPEKIGYYRRVVPDMIGVLDGVLLNRPRTEVEGGLGVERVVVKEVVKEVGGEELEELRKKNMGLFENVGRLEAKVADLTARLERCSRATDDEKCRWWMLKYDKLLAETRGGGEYDQTRG